MGFREICSALLAVALWQTLVVAEQDDIQRLQGTWRMATYYVDGKRVAYPALQYTILADRFEIRDEEQGRWAGRWTATGNHIDLIGSTNEGKLIKWQCVYDFRGETLRLCYSSSLKGRPPAVKVAPGRCVLELTR